MSQPSPYRPFSIVISALAAAALVGCATTAKKPARATKLVRASGAVLAGEASPPKKPAQASRTAPLSAEEVHQIIEPCLRAAHRLSPQAAHRCAAALDDLSSPDGALEAVVLTNAALLALEAGDRASFLRYASRMEASTHGLDELPPNTQLVLTLLSCMRIRCQRDRRVDEVLFQEVQRALERRSNP